MEFLDRLTPANQVLLNHRMVRKTFAKGEPVLTKGDSVSGAYFVLSGALRVFTLSPDGKEATLYRITEGETCVLALNSLFNAVLYPAWVEAVDDTTVAQVPGDTYRDLFQSEAAVQDITMRALSSAVFGLMSELEIRHAYTVDQRLAHFLLTRATPEGTVPYTQQSIASEIGTTREVVGRFMMQFAARGLVKSGRGRITLLDKAGLNGIVAYTPEPT